MTHLDVMVDQIHKKIKYYQRNQLNELSSFDGHLFAIPRATWSKTTKNCAIISHKQQ